MPVKERLRRSRLLDLLNDIDDLDTAGLYEVYAGIMDTFRRRLCDLWQIEYEDAWWVGADAVDGVLCIGDYYIKSEDVCLLVRHQLSFEDFMPWYLQWIDTGKENINLQSWLMGARPKIVDNEEKDI